MLSKDAHYDQVNILNNKNNIAMLWPQDIYKIIQNSLEK